MASDSLKKWFDRNDGKGWIDCKTGKPCGRKKGEKRRSYPACRPTKAQCTAAAKKKTSSKRISWKDGRTKKAKGGPINIYIARGCGKVMNNRRKKTKEY